MKPTGFRKSLYLSKRFSKNVRIAMKACQSLLASVFTCERSTPGMIRIYIHIANLLDHHYVLIKKGKSKGTLWLASHFEERREMGMMNIVRGT